MGRSLSFYAVNTNIPHDKSDKICIDLEYEKDFEDLKEELYKNLYPEEDSNLRQCKSVDDYFLHRKNQNECWISNCPNKIDWCNRCRMFVDGLYGIDIFARIDFNHSYSNPIWWSDWHFYNMYPGHSHSGFCNRFDSQRMYCEIGESDIEYMKRNLSECGKPCKTSDLEASEETEEVINFCEQHIKNPEITIIYDREY